MCTLLSHVYLTWRFCVRFVKSIMNECKVNGRGEGREPGTPTLCLSEFYYTRILIQIHNLTPLCILLKNNIQKGRKGLFISQSITQPLSLHSFFTQQNYRLLVMSTYSVRSLCALCGNRGSSGMQEEKRRIQILLEERKEDLIFLSQQTPRSL